MSPMTYRFMGLWHIPGNRGYLLANYRQLQVITGLLLGLELQIEGLELVASQRGDHLQQGSALETDFLRRLLDKPQTRPEALNMTYEL